MRPALPILPALMIMLSACQPVSEDAAATIKQAPAQIAAADCSQQYASPTVVRYHSQMDNRTQHSVHLLNAGADGVQYAGCAMPLPVASVVTLRYRVAGI